MVTMKLILFVLSATPAVAGAPHVAPELCAAPALATEKREGCERGVADIRRQLQEANVDGAFRTLDSLNGVLGLFKPYRGRCWGTLNGGGCTVAQAEGQRVREWYSNPDALAEQRASWAAFILEMDEARREKIASHHKAMREALAKEDYSSAKDEFAAAQRIGDDDDAAATELREALFVADKKYLLERPPAFEEGDTRWYAVPIYNPRLHPTGNRCKQLFGAAAEVEPTGGLIPRVRCAITESRVMTADELSTARDAVQAEERRPPTARQARTAVWSTLAATLGRRSPCPSGMATFSQVDARHADSCMLDPGAGTTFEERWTRCVGANPPKLVAGCEALMVAKDYCPSSKFEGDDCLVEECQSGLKPLAAVSDGLLKGCYRCPVGELDLEQTAASEHMDWTRMHTSNQRYLFQTIFCRVGPPRAASNSAAVKSSKKTNATSRRKRKP